MTSGDAYRVGVVPAEETRKSAPSILDALLFNIHCVYLLVDGVWHSLVKGPMKSCRSVFRAICVFGCYLLYFQDILRKPLIQLLEEAEEVKLRM